MARRPARLRREGSALPRSLGVLPRLPDFLAQASRHVGETCGRARERGGRRFGLGVGRRGVFDVVGHDEVVVVGRYKLRVDSAQ